MSRNMIFLGAPGAGKGTQSTVVADILHIPHISTGDIFRANIKEGTELGQLANSYIQKGELVPDEVTIAIVKDRISKPDCENGFILDGFPRTIPQAEALEQMLEEDGRQIDEVVNIVVDEEEVVKRISGRRSCSACGGQFNVIYDEISDEKCPTCGAPLTQRSDDKAKVIIERLKTYHEQTEPLIDFYKTRDKLLDVEGVPGIEKAIAITLKALGIKK